MTGALVEPKMKITPVTIGNGSFAERTGTKAAATDAYDHAPANTKLTAGSGIAVAGFQGMMQVYQAIADNNIEKLRASMQAFAAAKSPLEFIELQQELLSDYVASAISDGEKIGKLATDAFTASFKSARKQTDIFKAS